MTKMIFVNLPVKDLSAATEFYKKLGFKQNMMFSDENASSLAWSDTINVMLLREEFYQKFIPNKTIVDGHSMSEVLLCLSMDSRDEVDTFVANAVGGGGSESSNDIANSYGDAMYGKNIQDLDGHVWELLYMDMSQVPDNVEQEVGEI